MKDKILCVRKFETLVSSPEGNTEMFWIKFFPDKLLGSMNFKRCNCYEQSLYLAIFVRVRRDKQYCGMLVYPNGSPITIEGLIEDMNPPRRARTDIWKLALSGLLEKQLVYYINTTTSQLHTPLRANYKPTTSQLHTPLRANLKTQLTPYKELQQIAPTEESRVDKSREEESVFADIFTCWNSHDNLIRHRIITEKMKRAIRARLNEKYSVEQIKQSINNYSAILAGSNQKPPLYWWSYGNWTLVHFLQRNDNRFDDIEKAKIGFAIRGNINRPQATKPGTFSRGGGYFGKK